MPTSPSGPRWPLLLGVALALGGATLAAGVAAAPTSGALLQAAGSSPARSGSAGNGPGGGNEGAGVGNGANGASAPAKALVLTSAVLGDVRLGAPATLRVRVDNPNNQAVDLRAVTAVVSQVTSSPGTGPACRADDFHVSPFTAPAGARRVLKGGTTSVDLVITLRDTAANQDRCKRARYDFDVRATADQA